MIVKGLNKLEMEQAAAEVGVRFGEGLTPLNDKRDRWRCRLATVQVPYTGPRGGRHTKGKYERQSWRGRRLTSCVCWHGYRDFMQEVFRVNPNAVIKTGFAKYEGLAGFEENYRNTYYKNVGSMMSPAAYGDLCFCNDTYPTAKPPAGMTVKVRIVKHSDIAKCPHFILALEHYREDGTCRCDDPNAKVMREWNYRWSAKKGQWV